MAYCSPECQKEDSQLHSTTCQLLLTAMQHHKLQQQLKSRWMTDLQSLRILWLESLYKPFVQVNYFLMGSITVVYLRVIVLSCKVNFHAFNFELGKF